MMRATIFYEDQLAPGKQAKQYGPHGFVLACLGDRLGRDLFDLARHVTANPRKGDTKLLKACGEFAPTYRGANATVFALFDRDQLYGKLKLPRESTDEQLRAAVYEAAGNRDFEIEFLDPNLEAAVLAGQECEAGFSGENLQVVLEKRNLNIRDQYFWNLARNDPRSVRDCILDKLPGLKALVEKLVLLLAPATVPESLGT